MIARNHIKLIYAALALLTFIIVLFLSLNSSNWMRRESPAINVLIPARESRPMLYPAEGPFTSDDFMVIQQSVNRPVITEPISDRRPDSALIEHDCGTLTIIDVDRKVSLNADTMGTLNDTGQLAAKLREVFQQRVQQRAYLPGMETRTDLSDMQRIPRTVLIRAARSVSYGDLLTLIELLKELRADPIGLQVRHLSA